MLHYLRFVGEFLGHIFWSADAFLGVTGVVILVVGLASPDEWSTLPGAILRYAGIGLLVLSLTDGAYRAYYRERDAREQRDRALRLDVTVGSWSQMPGQDNKGTKFDLFLVWDIWADEEMETSKLAVEMVALDRGRWWKTPWRRIRPRATAIKGLCKDGAENRDVPSAP